MASMTEALTKTEEMLTFAQDDLRNALKGAGNLEALVILDLLTRLMPVKIGVANLLRAYVADERESDHVANG